MCMTPTEGVHSQKANTVAVLEITHSLLQTLSKASVSALSKPGLFSLKSVCVCVCRSSAGSTYSFSLIVTFCVIDEIKLVLFS